MANSGLEASWPGESSSRCQSSAFCFVKCHPPPFICRCYCLWNGRPGLPWLSARPQSNASVLSGGQLWFWGGVSRFPREVGNPLRPVPLLRDCSLWQPGRAHRAPRTRTEPSPASPPRPLCLFVWEPAAAGGGRAEEARERTPPPRTHPLTPGHWGLQAAAASTRLRWGGASGRLAPPPPDHAGAAGGASSSSSSRSPLPTAPLPRSSHDGRGPAGAADAGQVSGPPGGPGAWAGRGLGGPGPDGTERLAFACGVGGGVGLGAARTAVAAWLARGRRPGRLGKGASRARALPSLTLRARHRRNSRPQDSAYCPGPPSACLSGA